MFFSCFSPSGIPQQLVCRALITRSRRISLAVNVWESISNIPPPGFVLGFLLQREGQTVEAQELSRDKRYRWLSPQGIVPPRSLLGVWIMVPYHIAEARMGHIIHLVHLRLGWLIETCTLGSTFTHGTADAWVGAEKMLSLLTMDHMGSDLELPWHQPSALMSCSSRYLFSSHGP